MIYINIYLEMSGYPEANPSKVREQVKEIREWMKNNEELQKNQYFFRMEADKLFSNFREEYPSVYNLVITNQEMSILDQMLNTIEMINTKRMGQLDGEKLIGERLAEEYLYPVVKK